MAFVVDDSSILGYWTKLHLQSVEEDPDQVESAVRAEAPVRDIPASPTLDSADKPVRIRRSVLFSMEKVKNPVVNFDQETFRQLKKEHKILPPVRLEQEKLRRDQDQDFPESIPEGETSAGKRSSKRHEPLEEGDVADSKKAKKAKKERKRKSSVHMERVKDLFESDDEEESAGTGSSGSAVVSSNQPSSGLASSRHAFPKLEVDAARPVSHALKSQLMALPAPDLSRSEEAKKPIDLRVSVKSGDDTWSFVNVTVDRAAKVKRVLELVLQESKKVVFLNTDPDAYMLMLADADGRPDEDFAVALGTDQPIMRFNSNTFAMQKNKRSEEADQANQKPEKLFETAPQYRGFKDFQVLKIQMPDDSYLHLPYHPDTVLNKLLVLTCQKRGLSATEYTFVNPDTFDEMDLAITLGDVGLGVLRIMRRDAPVSHLKEQAKLLRTKSRKGSFSADKQTKRGPLFFLTPAIAAQYKTYSVLKLNPYGLKQQRTMGVAATEITNFKGDDADEAAAAAALAVENGDSPAKMDSPSLTTRVKEKPRRLSFMSLRAGVDRVRKRGSSKHDTDEKEAKAVAQTKHPSRPIGDILECDLDPKRGARAFFIRFKEKTIQYESEDAQEITAKINFLLSMHRNNEVVIV